MDRLSIRPIHVGVQTMVRFYICVYVCVCIYKSRLRFGFVCKPRFDFRFVSVQTCLSVCAYTINVTFWFVCS